MIDLFLGIPLMIYGIILVISNIFYKNIDGLQLNLIVGIILLIIGILFIFKWYITNKKTLNKKLKS